MWSWELQRTTIYQGLGVPTPHYLERHITAHVALESMPSLIGGSPHGKGMLQSADGGFNPRPPAQPTAKPALFLLLCPLGREPSARWRCHRLHSQGFRLPLVVGGKKSAVAARHLPRLPEARLMLLEGRHPRRAIGRIAREN